MAALTQTIKTIDAATATTTGAPINLKNVSRATIFVKRSNHSAGSTTLSVEVSPDFEEGVVAAASAQWVTYQKLISNAANTNAQTLTRVASLALSSNTTGFVTMDLENSGDVFKAMRVTLTEGTDGTHDAWVVLNYEY